MHSPAESRAHYSCVEVCSSVWLCPVCAAKIAERRRAELIEAVAQVEAQGGAVLHLTYTVRHDRHDDLANLVERFGRAYQRLTGHRTYRTLIRPTYQIFGSVRALETTHGEHGWHPHYHVLLFLSHPLTDAELARLEVELRALWVRAAALDGLSMNEHGFKLRAGVGAGNAYVAKWGMEDELTKSHIKRGREGGSSPWDLLRAAGAGDGRSAHLWREYAGVFKGRRQLMWSPGLRALLGLEDEKSDSEVATTLPDDAVHLGWITLADWLIVLRYGKRGQLLNVAGVGDWGLCRQFLAELRAVRLADRLRRGLEPPASLLLPEQLHFFARL
jgi:hypothetical protein